MLGDKAREMIIEDMQKKPMFPRIVFYTNFRELKPDTNPMFEEDVIATKGDYFIQYLKDKENTKYGTPFLLSSDLFPKNSIYVDSYEDLKRRIENAREKKNRVRCKILIEYSTLTPKHFDVAKQHPSLKLPFSLDVIKVYEEVKNNSEEGNRFILRPEMMQLAEETRRAKHVEERNWKVL